MGWHRPQTAGWLISLVLIALAPAASLAWEPTKPVEFVVPAGTGGGADQMARLVAGIAEKHKLSPKPFIVVNKAGGAGAEGFLDVKDKKGDAHTIIITLSNLFTTPLHTGVPFNWRDLTPVARLALDEFILWVNADTPYKTAREYIDAVKAKPGTFKMAGTGSAQEDQILTIQQEQALGVKFIYVPFKGGGEVCVNLVGKHVDSTVNNPIECVSHWKAGRVRPLAVFDTARLPVAEWKDVPTVKEALGVDIHYLMLRGIFGPPDMPKEAVAWYQDLFRKAAETPEWKKYMQDGALRPAFATGPEYVKWLEENEQLHKDLMAKGGLLKKSRERPPAAAPPRGGRDREVALRAADVTTALVLAAGGVLVLWDALQIGIGWSTDGPQSGFFPFWLAVTLLGCCASIVARRMVRLGDRRPFIPREAVEPVLKVLVPAIAFVALIQFIGLYVATALYMGFYMRWIGRHSWLVVVGLSLAVPVITFVVFEVWFLVPMPKGPLEAWLGY